MHSAYQQACDVASDFFGSLAKPMTMGVFYRRNTQRLREKYIFSAWKVRILYIFLFITVITLLIAVVLVLPPLRFGGKLVGDYVYGQAIVFFVTIPLFLLFINYVLHPAFASLFLRSHLIIPQTK